MGRYLPFWLIFLKMTPLVRHAEGPPRLSSRAATDISWP